MSKLWIIGDSFTGYDDGFWTEIITKKFKGKFYISSQGSRDYQTIMDIFLKNLKDISKDDLVILNIPVLERIRLPLKTPKIDVEFSNEYTTFETKKGILNYFIGNGNYQNVEGKELEEPLFGLEDAFFEDHKSGLNNRLWSIVNSSNANKKNLSEIIKSIKSYVPFEFYVWSWDNELSGDFIENKDCITEKIGIWETLHTLWQKTNGLEGKRDDAHFSPKMHTAFADYLIVKFPKFFNT
jgi:hypothetical protein